MSGDKELIALIDLIYQAALDNDLWPGLLIKLADAMGASQVSMTSRDQRADIFTTLSPRTDPDFLASYRQYWRLQNPLWQRTTSWRVGEIYLLDNLVREGITRPLPYLTNGGSHPGAALRRQAPICWLKSSFRSWSTLPIGLARMP